MSNAPHPYSSYSKRTHLRLTAPTAARPVPSFAPLNPGCDCHRATTPANRLSNLSKAVIGWPMSTPHIRTHRTQMYSCVLMHGLLRGSLHASLRPLDLRPRRVDHVGHRRVIAGRHDVHAGDARNGRQFLDV